MCEEDMGGQSNSSKSGWALAWSQRMHKSRLSGDGEIESYIEDMELMKDKFGKLLLGEDMSGGGKGVSSSLALSNAITNLAASVFSEQRRLEPMKYERKVRWRKEIDWLLSVTDHIVEFVPYKQTSNDGTQMEIMSTRQRTDLHMNIPALQKLDTMLIKLDTDLHMNIPALRKLDTMLIEYLDNFKNQNEFEYVSKDSDEAEKGNARNDDKWWLPTVKVPPGGLSDDSRKWLMFQKDSVNQVLKAAMAINSQVLSEMEIPEVYVDSLPKNGRASLGDTIYKSITLDNFNPEQFISNQDTSTEHKIVELKNKVEASVVIWKRKMTKDGKSSSWGSGHISTEKRELFEERAKTILILLKLKFPGIPQSALDISKIQYNGDVGQSILESYSRILESLAFTVMSQIEDVLKADSIAKDSSIANVKRDPMLRSEAVESTEQPGWLTVVDFTGWQVGEQEQEMIKRKKKIRERFSRNLNDGKLGKHHHTDKLSYIEKLQNSGGVGSPTARQ